MNYLIVGFGGMGCRHAQSLLDAKLCSTVFVVEPNNELLGTNISRIGYTEKEIISYPSIQDVPAFDFAIVATSAEPRFEIVKQLLQKKCNYLLLEKVVFQSVTQFEEIEQIAREHHTYITGNLPNRYFKNYIALKKTIRNISEARVTMQVTGGAFGLACNSIHYLDLFTYLTNDVPSKVTSNLTASAIENRRGSQYKELNGALHFTNPTNTKRLSLISNSAFQGGVVVSVQVNEESFFFYENEQTQYNSDGEIKPFTLIPSSKLTAHITQDMLNSTCLLPSLSEMKETHRLLFSAFNPAFGLKDEPSTICPIT
jgi:predicted dehydrogenase